MAVYVMTGFLGSGKSLCSVGRIRDYLWAGKKVRTNMDLRVENLVSGKQFRDIMRIPDRPSADDLWALGYGSDSRDESTFGCLVIDECGPWLNARDWTSKDRGRVLEWLVHSRKRRWDVYLIAQSVNMLDKQVRDAVSEHVVTCSRTDRLPIPYVNFLLNLAGFGLKLPLAHVAKARYMAGGAANAPVVARWFYTAKDLYKAYDTAQVFSTPETPSQNDGWATMLSPDRYTWLQRPHSVFLSFQEVCYRRGWEKLAKVLDAIRPMGPAEANYRYLKVLEEHGAALLREPSRSFEDWAREQDERYRQLTEPTC